MLEISKLQVRQWKENKASVAFFLFYCMCAGFLLPMFGKEDGVVGIIALSLSFIVQIAPELFAMEKEKRRLEILLSLPLSMKKIFRGKVLYSFGMITAVLYISIILSWIMKLFRIEDLQIGVQEVFVIFLCVPIAVYNLSTHAAYLSLKSNDSRACALSSIVLSSVYVIMPIVLYICISFPMKLWLVIFAGYLILNIVNAIILHWMTRRYMDKRQIFLLFRY